MRASCILGQRPAPCSAVRSLTLWASGCWDSIGSGVHSSQHFVVFSSWVVCASCPPPPPPNAAWRNDHTLVEEHFFVTPPLQICGSMAVGQSVVAVGHEIRHAGQKWRQIGRLLRPGGRQWSRLDEFEACRTKMEAGRTNLGACMLPCVLDQACA